MARYLLTHLPPYMINEEGIIKEWLTPELENNDHHRHSSQLYPLYDGISDEISESMELQQAFKRSIEYKLDKHWRNNPGGLLNVAIDVAEKFIPQGELVVFTKGRIEGQNLEFRSKRGKKYLEMPLVIMINDGSASGSEIVAGVRLNQFDHNLHAVALRLHRTRHKGLHIELLRNLLPPVFGCEHFVVVFTSREYGKLQMNSPRWRL